MMKIILGLGLFFMINTTATAEVYHGIDIDDVYKSSEWNSKNEIKQLIDDYFLSYPKIKNYTDSIIAFAREKGYVETLFGRRRYLPDINSHNSVVRG